jgi:hypothetical protein
MQIKERQQKEKNQKQSGPHSVNNPGGLLNNPPYT